MSTAKERADKGAAWLDGVVPGWRSRVDVERIDLTTPTDCIAGQVFVGKGDCEMRCGYCHLITLLRKPERMEYGFEAEGYGDADTLRAAWTAAVNGTPKEES